ncbi:MULTISPECIES: Gfo/Idh/MocA family oxidoreductase [Brevibacterium]|uniref:Predicted dehydrogenase n=1 Tax=Brevibacterium antiquum CNRZ 918 TaxID=1255637 RepID=A0A2H1K4G6_9MICO|nr:MULTISPECIES: Gfo/Idh/MocA family oxidoreductase [Brevibacterium]SMX94539.1 Predicted dehydrogenase [Brevibacterium antiquum CNRZ 918]HCG55692.1 gfo/Idh/MocA family oxidoreductase [Brevibacterium sp.]
MTRELRAGLIGMGAMGRNHARVLSLLSDVEFVGVVDPLLPVEAGPAGIPLYRTVDELLAEEEIDMCVVAVPTKFHVEVALELASKDISTLIEKPLAGSIDDAERIVDIFAARDVFAGVGHIERFNPSVRELRKRLDGRALGEVIHISTTRVGPFPARIADVGVIFDLASHDIDLVQWITGSTYRELYAQTAYRSGRTHEDLVSITGVLADGTVIDHRIDWLSPFKQRQTVVTGEGGAFVADTLTADLTHYRNGDFDGGWDDLNQFRGVAQGDVTRYAINKKEPLLAELEAFRDATLGLSNNLATVLEGLEVVKVADEVSRTAKANQPTHN